MACQGQIFHVPKAFEFVRGAQWALNNCFRCIADAPGMDFDPMTLFLPELFGKLSYSIIYAPDEEAEARIIEAFTILLNLSKRYAAGTHF